MTDIMSSDKVKVAWEYNTLTDKIKIYVDKPLTEEQQELVKEYVLIQCLPIFYEKEYKKVKEYVR